ncbi:hypothetical protein N2E09_07840 [Leuconostoc citreum]
MINNKNSKNINNGSVQINGDGDNTIIALNPGVVLTETEVYDLLLIVDDMNIKPSVEYSLTDPAELNEKLFYNNAPIYIDYFEEYSVHLVPIEEVMDNLPNSARIVQKLRKLFLKEAKRNEFRKKIVGNGDEQLDAISEKLRLLIKSDTRFLKKSFSEEGLDQFIMALLAYGVYKCKVLLNPNEG